MVGKASPSETLAWWARAAQARRVAGMLSPPDAQLAEAYAAECEAQARGASSGVRSARCAVAPSVENLIPNSVGRVSPRQLIVRIDAADLKRRLHGRIGVIDGQSIQEVREESNEEIKPAEDGKEAGRGSGDRGNVPGLQTSQAIGL